MAQFRPNGRNIKSLLKSKRVEQQALKPAAEKLAPLVASLTPESNRAGPHTRSTTSVEPGHKSVKGDRVSVRVTQRTYSGRGRPGGGAAAPLQFGNAITRKRAQFTKAMKLMRIRGGA